MPQPQLDRGHCHRRGVLAALTASVWGAGLVLCAASGALAQARPGAAAPAGSAAAGGTSPAAAPASRPDDTLVLGVLPNIGADQLVQQYDLMRRYLAQQWPSQPVRVVVPTSFKAFFDALMRGDYDLAVAAPHFARVAQLDRGMVPLVGYEPRIDALFLAPVDSRTTTPQDVSGQAVAFANPQSLVALYGLQWLAGLGLQPERHFVVKGARSDLGVGRMVLVGEAAAAVMSQGEFRSLPADERARLRIVTVFAQIPNFIVLAHPRLGAVRQNAVRDLLKAFLADRVEGAAFAQATGVRAMADISAATLRELDPFVQPTRRAMGQ